MRKYSHTELSKESKERKLEHRKGRKEREIQGPRSTFDNADSITSCEAPTEHPVLQGGDITTWHTEPEKRRFRMVESLVIVLIIVAFVAFGYDAHQGVPEAGTRLFDRMWPTASAGLAWFYGGRLGRSAAK